MKERYTFEEFCDIMKELRGEHGCPWDRTQTHGSLIPCMIEEAYEVVDGIQTLEQGGSPDSLCEELGDVLMQVVFHGQLAEEEGYFTLEDVTSGISRKMIHRHPHVFGDIPAEKWDWESLKKEEHEPMTPQEEIEAIPRALPALIRTSKILKKMDKYYGFGREEEESLQEIKENLKLLEHEEQQEKQEEEIGQMFLHLCNYARKKGINSELLLESTLENLVKTYKSL